MIESQKKPDFDKTFERKKSGQFVFKAKFLSNYPRQPYIVIHGKKAVNSSFVLVLPIFISMSIVKFVQ